MTIWARSLAAEIVLLSRNGLSGIGGDYGLEIAGECFRCGALFQAPAPEGDLAQTLHQYCDACLSVFCAESPRHDRSGH